VRGCQKGSEGDDERVACTGCHRKVVGDGGLLGGRGGTLRMVVANPRNTRKGWPFPPLVAGWGKVGVVNIHTFPRDTGAQIFRRPRKVGNTREDQQKRCRGKTDRLSRNDTTKKEKKMYRGDKKVDEGRELGKKGGHRNCAPYSRSRWSGFLRQVKRMVVRFILRYLYSGDVIFKEWSPPCFTGGSKKSRISDAA